MEKRVMTVNDVMTREVVTLFEEESVAGIEEAMDRYRFHHLPVVDGDKLVGLVTHRDLLQFDTSPAEGIAEQRTRERAERTFDVWSMAMAGGRLVMESEAGLSIRSRNCRAKAENDST